MKDPRNWTKEEAAEDAYRYWVREAVRHQPLLRGMPTLLRERAGRSILRKHLTLRKLAFKHGVIGDEPMTILQWVKGLLPWRLLVGYFPYRHSTRELTDAEARETFYRVQGTTSYV